MALVHIAFIRSYNSIYQQAPHTQPADYRDFVSYRLAWHEMMQGHHDSEEEVLFPGIKEATGVKGIMDRGKAEHGKSIQVQYLRQHKSTNTTNKRLFTLSFRLWQPT